MTKLMWDEDGDRLYETGTKMGVLYPKTGQAGAYGKGVAWNGLTAVTESPSGAEATDLYADDIKYLSLRSAETFGGTIEAYTFPDEWMQCDGSALLAEGLSVGQQARKAFGLCYRTILGNDEVNNDYGYKLHIVYNATASPSEKSYATVNDSPEAVTFSWEFTTNPTTINTPVNINGTQTKLKPSATVVIDSTKVDGDKLIALEDLLYGTESAEPKLPTIDEIIKLFEITSGTTQTVKNNG